jgi:hypothetical protein
MKEVPKYGGIRQLGRKLHVKILERPHKTCRCPRVESLQCDVSEEGPAERAGSSDLASQTTA